MNDWEPPTIGDVAKRIPKPGDIVTVRASGKTFTMKMIGEYNYDGEELSMKHYDVTIGDPEGLNGDTLNIQARTSDEAREQALDNDLMRMNPTWVVKTVVLK